MLTEPVGADAQRLVGALPAAFTILSAEIVDRLEEQALPELLVRALGTLIPFDYCELFVYRNKAGPIHVYDCSLTPDARHGLLNYLQGTYVLNPFYRRYRLGLKTGAYRLGDLAPGIPHHGEDLRNFKVSTSSSEEIGYLTEGWPAGRRELCIALEMPNGECAEIAVARKPGEGAFSTADVTALNPAIPFLAAVFRHHWRETRLLVGNEARDHQPTGLQSSLANMLSPREREVTRLLLSGHSTLSISLRLGISTTTVKTHRKNLYAKLGIATQFELFSMFKQSLHVGCANQAHPPSGGL
jgi:DNA-binding CsgD family transcriptional regulator